MSLTVLPGGGADIDEPDWSLLLPGPPDLEFGIPLRFREFAHREWQRITSAMRAAETLAPENRHQIQRLITAYVRYDFASSMLFQLGAITQAKRTKVQQMNLWQSELRAADNDATVAEQELGLSPRRRAAAGKVAKKPRQASAADGYLATVKKG